MSRNLMILSCLFAGAVLGWSPLPDTFALETTTSRYDAATRPLRLETVLSLVETEHPLLHGSRTEKLEAQGKLLKALGAFEPILVNDLEVERLVKNGQTKNVGFNDTIIQMRHPWGVRGFAGWRTGLGDVEVADLGVQQTNQPLLGIVLPLLRGLGTNPEQGELEKSKLAEQEATLNIQQTRQGCRI